MRFIIRMFWLYLDEKSQQKLFYRKFETKNLTILKTSYFDTCKNPHGIFLSIFFHHQTGNTGLVRPRILKILMSTSVTRKLTVVDHQSSVISRRIDPWINHNNISNNVRVFTDLTRRLRLNIMREAFFSIIQIVELNGILDTKYNLLTAIVQGHWVDGMANEYFIQ